LSTQACGPHWHHLVLEPSRRTSQGRGRIHERAVPILVLVGLESEETPYTNVHPHQSTLPPPQGGKGLLALEKLCTHPRESLVHFLKTLLVNSDIYVVYIYIIWTPYLLVFH
jgi:hypothetical protein